MWCGAILFFLCGLFFCCSHTASAGRVIDFQGAGKAQREAASKEVKQEKAHASSQEIRVGLLLGQKSVLISSDAGFSIVEDGSGKVLTTIAPNAAIKLEGGGAGIFLDGKRLSGASLRLVPQRAEGIFQIGAGHYRGSFFVRVESKGLDLIEQLPLDDYVNGVLAEEMPASWHIEALKAQAVAAQERIAVNAVIMSLPV